MTLEEKSTKAKRRELARIRFLIFLIRIFPYPLTREQIALCESCLGEKADLEKELGLC